jgi:DNA polymerase-4
MALAAPRICCLDLDTFFVSVERLLDPRLVGRPVVVGGLPGQRGVVTAASYEVRAFGVRSGMSLTKAAKLAPHAVFLPTRHGVYGEYAAKVRRLAESYTPVSQVASIDEMFLDFSGCERLYAMPGDPSPDATIERVVRKLTDEIQAQVGLPSSAGIATSRSVAKVASGLAKPRGVLMVPAGTERAFLGPLPVRKFPGIGPVAEQKLVALGLTTLADVQSAPLALLERVFGAWAGSLVCACRGEGAHELGRERPAFQEHDPSGSAVGTISNERTFREDVTDPASIDSVLCALCERVCFRARKRGVKARTVSLKLRYADFQTLQRSRTITPTSSELELYPVIRDLFERARTRRTAIRLLRVRSRSLSRSQRSRRDELSPIARSENANACESSRFRSARRDSLSDSQRPATDAGGVRRVRGHGAIRSMGKPYLAAPSSTTRASSGRRTTKTSFARISRSSGEDARRCSWTAPIIASTDAMGRGHRCRLRGMGTDGWGHERARVDAELHALTVTAKNVSNLAASVQARLQNHARTTKRPFQELLQYYAMERFLYRLSTTPHSKRFVLKGALMLHVWKAPLARATKDLDFLGRIDNSLENLERVVREICTADVEPDGMVFDPATVKTERIKEDADYEGVRVRFVGLLGKARVTMQIDVGFGDVVTPGALDITYPALLDFPAPALSGYPRETVVAEKFQAMVYLRTLCANAVPVARDATQHANRQETRAEKATAPRIAPRGRC